MSVDYSNKEPFEFIIDDEIRQEKGVYPYLLVLYCRKNKYPIQVTLFGQLVPVDSKISGRLNQDCLYKALSSEANGIHFDRDNMRDLLGVLYSMDDEELSGIYAGTVKDLILDYVRNRRDSEELCLINGALAHLIATLINNADADVVYHPYTGLGEITEYLKCNKYVGQDFRANENLLARVLIDAMMGQRGRIFDENPLDMWCPTIPDVIVSAPPMGLKISKEQLLQTKSLYPLAKCTDDLCISQTIQPNCRLGILVVRPYLFHSPSYRENRIEWCKSHVINTIIELPENLANGPSTPLYLLLITPYQKQSYIRFIDAKEAIKTKQIGDCLDERQILSILKDVNSPKSICVPYSVIEENNYSLHPGLYFYSYLLDKENDYKPLSNYVEFERGKRFQFALGLVKNKSNHYVNLSSECKPERIVNLSHFSSDYYEIIRNNEGYIKSPYKAEYPSSGRYFVGPHLFIASQSGTLKYLIHNSAEGILLPDLPIVALKAKDDILLEYLVYQIIGHKKEVEALSVVSRGLVSSVDSDYLAKFKIEEPISHDKQKEFCDQLLSEYYAQKNAEIEAERQRHGLRSSQSDILHMLGTPLVLQANYINQLKYMNCEDPELAKGIKSLIDSCEYISRLLNSAASDFSAQNFSVRQKLIADVVREYCEAVGNMMGENLFTLSFDDGGLKKTKVLLNPDRLRILLDAIINNAYRHGFHKVASKENKIHVQLSEVDYKGRLMVLLSIMNNGEPLSPDFRLKDYISRGRYTGTDGHSGLGGNHVYQIAKKHNGYIAFNSKEQWPFIIEVLLPVSDSKDKVSIVEYDNEAI